MKHVYDQGEVWLNVDAVAGVYWSAYVVMSHDALIGVLLKAGERVNLQWFGADNDAAKSAAKALAVGLGLLVDD